MRTKTAIYNNITSTLLQFTILIFGLIIPRMMIQNYGSEMNGLVSSTKQMISYLNYLDLGITAALVYTLYQPMASKNFGEINPLVTRIKKEYEKVSLGYFIGVILISALYPILLREEIGYFAVFSLVFIIGLYGILDFVAISKYRVVLDSDLKTYVINLITTITLVLQYIITILLLLNNSSIYIILLIPTLVLPLRNVMLKIYFRRNYKKINFYAKPSNIKFTSRVDAFISGLTDSLEVGLPIVIVSLIISLEMASVFSVYSMIFIGISAIVKVFNSGMRTVFGNINAKNEEETFNKTYNYFEFVIFLLLTILLSTTLALTIPFIRIYVKDVSDIEYIYPLMGVLFTFWSVFHNFKVPNQTIIDATGKWKIMTKHNIIEILILFSFSLLLGYLIGINGILIGMIISSIYKAIIIIFITNKSILNGNSKRTFMRLLLMLIVIIVSNVPIYLSGYTNLINNISKWILAGFLIMGWVSLLTIVIIFIFERKTVKEIYQRYISKKRTL